RHNRVVERHTSRYGAYWKSYDFAGSVGSQNIFTHPLDFTHDGGEIIFNLPNGLQAYLLVDANGNRLNDAPIEIVSNPAASDPTVRNGLSCIGCHTQGMKMFTDSVRAVIEQDDNPPYNKEHALRLYPEQSVLDDLVAKDTERFQQALEKIGGPFSDDASKQQFFKRCENEPIQRFHELFQAPLNAAHAAASVGLETDAFLTQIREKQSLKNLGLQTLIDVNGTVKRDAWTSNFDQVISALNTPDSTLPPVVERPELIPGESVHIPDENLRAVIEEALGKASGDTITVADMATLQKLDAPNKNISDLTGLAFAKNLIELYLHYNPLSDISPLASLTKLRELHFPDTEVADLSPLSGLLELEVIDASATRIKSLAPLAGLKNLQKLDTVDSDITDLSPLAGLTNLTRLRLYDVKATDLSPLKGLTKLKWLGLTHTENISDLSPLSGLTDLEHLDLFNTEIVDVSPLSGLVNLETLILANNRIVDVSPLASLRNLKNLNLHGNNISDFSPLDGIRKNLKEFTWYDNPAFPQGGPKIAGPWQWLMLPVQAEGWGGVGLLTDYLKAASEGKVTEQQIATLGASAGDVVGDSVWSVGTLESYNFTDLGRNRNNVRRLLDPQGAIEDLPDFHYPKQGLELVVYGSITLYSPQTQQTRIFVGASLGRKVWLNGKLLHEEYIIDRNNYDYQNVFPATLKKGKNVVLVACEYWYSRWSLFFGFEPNTEYNVVNPRVGYTFSEPKIHAGDTFTLDISAEDVYDLAGWQFDIAFDPEVLEAIEVNEGDFLKKEGGTTFFQKGTIDNATGKISKLSSARLNEDGVTGTGTLLSVTFTAKAGGETRLSLRNFQLGSVTGEAINAGPHEFVFTIEGQLATGDVNRDGQVSVLDLILVSRHLGEDASANPQADVNRDGIINIQDLIIVAQHLGESTAAAAPSAIAINNGELTPTMIQAWITQAQLENDGSLAFRQGIANLERLLALFIPEETVLLHNYPNPFNPETWIPYQLAKPAEVTLIIYAPNGAVVRTLELGHQPAGFYESRSRAAYWDGRNEVGEPVASGIYFYTLSTESTRDSVTAGDFNATRKMLIRK
ncbi:hypothetical protein C6499_14070, partial [Candidatus Poribacteria bacterium]